LHKSPLNHDSPCPQVCGAEVHEHIAENGLDQRLGVQQRSRPRADLQGRCGTTTKGGEGGAAFDTAVHELVSAAVVRGRRAASSSIRFPSAAGREPVAVRVERERHEPVSDGPACEEHGVHEFDPDHQAVPRGGRGRGVRRADAAARTPRAPRRHVVGDVGGR